jgi:hypothetical protein
MVRKSLTLGANPITVTSYNARAVKIYNATNRLGLPDGMYIFKAKNPDLGKF